MKKASGSKIKVLYAFQGTGNGHASRALELIPHLQKHCELKVLCSGSNSQLDLGFPLDYHFKGISFSYNKQGGLSYWQSFRNARFWRFKKEVDQLDLSTFDLILNDFEPVSAYAVKKSKVPLIGLSHQAAFLSPKTPRPKAKNLFAEWVFRHYAPCSKATAFHFEAYDDFIQHPILRSKVKDLELSQAGKYLVYLPAYNEQLLKQLLSQVKEAEWLIFSKECKEDYHFQNLEFRKIDGDSFLNELAAAKGLLCSAGFEAPAEALYLKKKLFVIPIKGQYEQDCNAEALNLKGVPSVKTLNKNSLSALKNWVSNPQQLEPQKITAAKDLIISILDNLK